MRTKIFRLASSATLVALTTFFISTLVVPQGASVSAAGSAALSFAPASGTETVGSNFSVKVVVDSGGGIGVNAADGKVSFDPSLLAVQSVSKESSIFNLWVADPSFSNTDGTVTFSGGGTAAYTGTAGTVVTIAFKALKAGSATLKFASGDVLAADGQGTNVLGTQGTATYTLGGSAPASSGSSSSGSSGSGSKPSPSPAPVAQATPFIVTIPVSSPTHPNQQAWYPNANPSFTWTLTSDVAGVATAFTKDATTLPKRVSEGLLSTKSYANVTEGTWYFHVRFEDSLGNWSDAVTYQVQIDLSAPSAFTINSQPGGGLSGRTLLAFNATDTMSGIDHYEYYLDGGPTSTIALTEMQNGTYTLPPVLAGKHTIVIRAVDKAGNYTEANNEFEISGVSSPKITNFPATVIERSPIVLEGIADSGANVTVDILSAGKVASEGKMVADQAGHWLYAVEGGLGGGRYDLAVAMVTAQGAMATSSDPMHIDVISAPFLDRFGWALIVLLLCTIAGLIGFGFYRKKLMDLQLSLAKRENSEVGEKTRAVFEALREEMTEKVNHMEGGALQAQGEQKLEPENVLDSMRNALSVSETIIQKEVDDVDKALKGE